MSFSSPVFILLFAPLFFISYFLFQGRLRNGFLLLGSLFFYVWGEPLYFPIILVMIGFNYAFGIAIEKNRNRGNRAQVWLFTGLGINIFVLLAYKLFATYGAYAMIPLWGTSILI